MAKKPTTVAEYLKGLPEDRRKALEAVRRVIRKNLPRGYAEGIQYGMIGYFVPHGVYPDGYHCDPSQPLPFASIASQKNHMAVYLMCVYGDEAHKAWFVKAWKATGKKLDMGKSCVRFKKIEDVPLDVLGEAIARVPVRAYIEHYESAIRTMGKRGSKKKVSKKPASKRIAKKKVAKASKKKAVTKKAAKKKGTKKAAAKKMAKKTSRKKASVRR
ncbi:MAG: DUF1801 domain-containing protein [Phycisphaera sp.]|nr:MAG: DUF1801 domain-containing protein [Phycisphaera sp.]